MENISDEIDNLFDNQSIIRKSNKSFSLASCLVSLILAVFAISCSNNTKVESLRSLGTEEFSREKWAKADEVARGRMIYSLIKSNGPITNKDRAFIISQLGENTGYHDYDSYPAYYVGPKPPNSEAKAYLLAFTIDHKTGKVKDIYVEPEIK